MAIHGVDLNPWSRFASVDRFASADRHDHGHGFRTSSLTSWSPWLGSSQGETGRSWQSSARAERASFLVSGVFIRIENHEPLFRTVSCRAKSGKCAWVKLLAKILISHSLGLLPLVPDITDNSIDWLLVMFFALLEVRQTFFVINFLVAAKKVCL